ncbi:MAG: AbrB/MazE/SpoVT family DNA-binding domain-containing protein [Desulfobulbus sp.]|nr:AbrB/MazE/SpoVT family DNA-binding domain-containing protein [Desulfobulbus sp.]
MGSQNAMTERTAKLFKNGASQAVRLPAEFRFEGDEVYIWRDPHTGAVVLSPRQRVTRDEFLRLRDELPAKELARFMDVRIQPPAQTRAILAAGEEG